MIEVEIRMPSRATGEYFAAARLRLRDDGSFVAEGVWKWIIPMPIYIDDGCGFDEPVSLWDDPEAWLMNLDTIMHTDSHVPVITEFVQHGRPAKVERLDDGSISAAVDAAFAGFVSQSIEPSRRDVVQLLKTAGYKHPPTNAVNSVLSETIGWPVRYSVSEVADKLATWTEEKEIRDDER